MMVPTSEIGSAAGSAAMPAREETGFVFGSVRALLRLEGFAALATAGAIYAHAGFSWAAFALFFFAPDLSMLAYFAGARTGGLIYNLAHNYAFALALTFAGFLGDMPAATAGGLIWIAHIGFDRALGYGLKYPTGFGDTHLGRIGRR
jgi:hypothetical protein